MAILDLPEFADTLPARAAILGVDPGEKRIGVAVSDLTRLIASPLDTVQRVKFAADAEALLKLYDGRQCAGFVIGLPLNMDGSSGPAVLAATNRDLEREVKEGRFREDLFYRLSVVTLRVPPLRERTEDLPLLAANALRQAREAGARATTISEEALAVLNQYEWPGNVRELENTIAHAALYARGNVITPEDLPAKVRKQGRQHEPEKKGQSMFQDLPSLDELERRYLIHVLHTVGGSRTRAADVLGIDRRTLYRMAERFGINLKESGE